MVNFQWRQQPCAAATAWVRDAEWLQAVEEREESNRVLCCDVSSLLQHGAHELKNLGHYILLSGIHTARRTRHSASGYQRMRSVHHPQQPIQLRLPPVIVRLLCPLQNIM